MNTTVLAQGIGKDIKRQSDPVIEKLQDKPITRKNEKFLKTIYAILRAEMNFSTKVCDKNLMLNTDKRYPLTDSVILYLRIGTHSYNENHEKRKVDSTLKNSYPFYLTAGDFWKRKALTNNKEANHKMEND